MTRRVLLLCMALALFVGPAVARAADVHQIKVQGVIGPPVSQFIAESITKAGEDRASALVILLDTPGGLDTSMRAIVQAIMDSSVPVITYVYPSGARAASAGTIILIASHVAAMAPGTNVGAAHPVSLGGEKPDKEMMAKVLHDAEAYARSLATKRGRNAEWAAKAVTQSVSVTADEALSEHVIDIVAPSVEDLLAKVDGKTVEVGNKKVVLRTTGARTVPKEMPFRFKLLSYLTDPNVAYLLMMIGFYGILFEIFSPGTVFPGVIGAICLILAFYAFQTIPINYAGLALIVLGVIFFILELKIVSYGMLSVAGIASIVIGSIMLVDVPVAWLSISWQTILLVTVLTIVFFLAVLSYAVKAQLSKVRTGREGLIGEKGIARSDIAPAGKVFVHGELWEAVSEAPVKAGERVVVVSVQDMIIKVERERRTTA
jgi:membrane-bound serine protease (ClpP class)